MLVVVDGNVERFILRGKNHQLLGQHRLRASHGIQISTVLKLQNLIVCRSLTERDFVSGGSSRTVVGGGVRL